MSFTDQQPRIATEKEIKMDWGGGANGKYFRCYLCGYKFKVGDYWRWVFSNNVSGAGGNPLVCKTCDGSNEEVIAKWKVQCQEYQEIIKGAKYWWFNRHYTGGER